MTDFLATYNQTTSFLFDIFDLPGFATEIRGLPDRGTPVVGLYDGLHNLDPRQFAGQHILLPYTGKFLGVHSLVQDRIIQLWLERVEFQAHVILVPVSLLTAQQPPTKAGMGRTFVFIMQKHVTDFETWLSKILWSLSVSGLSLAGYVKLDVSQVHAAVHYTWTTNFQNTETITVAQFHQAFWKRAISNGKGVIHNFLQGIPAGPEKKRTPILAPSVHYVKPSNRSSELSHADVVLVGILTGLLARDASYADFEGPTPFEFVGWDKIAGRFREWLIEATIRKG